VAHGHVQDLLEKCVDYVLLPNTVSMEGPDDGLESHMCPWNQTLPFVVRAVPQLEAAAAKFLAPTVHFHLGPKLVEK
jgi:predicted nucleotide-binding protein (sugar kinase/HSP70/actin superfamily)